MPKVERKRPTAGELIEVLNRSSLPTVLVEGNDDVIVFRRLEDYFIDLGISVLPVGGRECVLEIFQRRKEIKHPKTLVFIADRDVWSISGIPAEYDSTQLIFTRGYSIENDIYIDGNFESLLFGGEQNNLNSEIDIFSKWYSLAVYRFLNGKHNKLDTHPDSIFSDPLLKQGIQSLEAGETFPTDLFERIKKDYKLLIRGKSLFGLLMRQLSYKGRAVRHRHDSLIEQVAVNRGDLLSEIFERVGTLFKPAQHESA